jgi:hypothetical protein
MKKKSEPIVSKNDNRMTAGAHGFMGFYDHNFGYFDREYDDDDDMPTEEEIYAGFKEFSEQVCESYVDNLQMYLSSKGMNRGKDLPPITKIDYVCQHNPKEYNFTTDKIEMLVHVTSKEKFGQWVRRYTEDNYEEWDNFLKGQFTSYDGFISWFSNDPEEWKSLSDNYQNIGEISERKNDTYVPLQTILGFYLWMEHDLWDFPGTRETRTGKVWWDSLQGSWEQYVVSEI